MNATFGSMACSLAFALAATAAPDQAQPWRNAAWPVEQRVESLLARLTLAEKSALCSGGFSEPGAPNVVPRLGIPPLLMLDGRQGVRPLGRQKDVPTTLLPCTLSLSCTWDLKAAEAFGGLLAEEMLALDRHLLLAPMINMVRSPLGGRNFENFGEDPLLAGLVAAAYVRGVQTRRVGACACLVAANDCETRRHFTNSNLDERTLREVHLIPAELAFRDGGVWSMMSANSLLNGVHCAQNRHLLQEVLKDRIGFDGAMITDWRAAYDTVPTATAGTDIATGFCKYVFGGGRLLEAVKSGQVPEALLDDKVRRILRLYIRCGAFEPDARAKGGIDTPEHRATARRLAAQGMVLLKNERQTLPWNPANLRTILITGPSAAQVLQGGGSGSVPSSAHVAPLPALTAALGAGTRLVHVPYSAPLQMRLAKGSVEWQNNGRAGDGKDATVGGIPDPSELAAAARHADAVIFVAAGVLASEGNDLPNMDLPGRQAEAISALAAVNSNVVVVLAANGAVALEPWIDRVPALLAMHYAGQATGAALADVLTGRVEPAGRLSYTFARRLDDYPCHALGEWPAKLILDHPPADPGLKPDERKAVHAYDTAYDEGVFVGHRWFDEKGIEPRFAFGHGLGYTTFGLSDLMVTETGGALRVSCMVTNTGRRAGAAVVQIYVAPPKASIPRPPMELKGFARLTLEPGGSGRAETTLRPSALAYFDARTGDWKIDPGQYEIRVGCSSRDIRLRAATSVTASRRVEHY